MPRLSLASLRSLAIIAVALIAGGSALIAHADKYDDQINALQAKNNSAQSSINGLAATATNYQDAINQLQGQISSLQAALNANVAKQTDLTNQITTDQQNITQDKASLSAVIRALYVDGQLTTIEELATSKNLNDYVDKETYRTSVQNKVDGLIKQLSVDEAQLKTQKNQLDIVVNTQKQQDAQLASAQAQQQQLLAYNQSQQDSFNQQIKSNQSQISQLKAEQIAANRQLVSRGGGGVITSGACGGGYPASASGSYGNWGCNYPLDNTLDNWGMYNRECVSYTAWKVYQTYGYMPYWGGSGNANSWPGNARAAGIPTGSTPKVGSVAIYMGGAGDPWGHAMWVVGVNGNMITVDQYNLYYDGKFYETTINGSGLTYIYFGG